MKKTSLVSLSGLLLMGAFFANAGEKLDEINAEVEQRKPLSEMRAFDDGDGVVPPK